jgi:hypothetical protein
MSARYDFFGGIPMKLVNRSGVIAAIYARKSTEQRGVAGRNVAAFPQ